MENILLVIKYKDTTTGKFLAIKKIITMLWDSDLVPDGVGGASQLFKLIERADGDGDNRLVSPYKNFWKEEQ